MPLKWTIWVFVYVSILFCYGGLDWIQCSRFVVDHSMPSILFGSFSWSHPIWNAFKNSFGITHIVICFLTCASSIAFLCTEFLRLILFGRRVSFTILYRLYCTSWKLRAKTMVSPFQVPFQWKDGNEWMWSKKFIWWGIICINKVCEKCCLQY